MSLCSLYQSSWCTKEFQALGLAAFYYFTGGPHWINTWPLPSTQDEALDMLFNSSSGGWNSTFMGQTCNMTDGNFTVVVPAWCCWYGISCCLTSAPCPPGIPAYDQSIRGICGNCAVGLVTRIGLAYNNVSETYYSQSRCFSYRPAHSIFNLPLFFA